MKFDFSNRPFGQSRRRGWGFLFAGLFFSGGLVSALSQEAAGASKAPQPETATIIMVQGTVDVMLSGTRVWTTASEGQKLRFGDQIRTGRRSRAQLRLTNRAVLPINESTSLTLEQPPDRSGRAILNLKTGSLFYRSRSRGRRTSIRTPLASGAIRGTEFHLAVGAGGQTTLTLLDGEVALSTRQGEMVVGKGEEARVGAGAPIQKSAVIDAVNIIQWTLHYPAVLDSNELPDLSDWGRDLASSLNAYRAGRLPDAMAAYPSGREPRTESERIYLAALLLSVGQVEESLSRLQGRQVVSSRGRSLADALRSLIAAVKQEEPPGMGKPRLATEFMAASYWEQSRGQMEEALSLAQRAVEVDPEFGLAWMRRAELEFGSGLHTEAKASLDLGLSLSPGHAHGFALRSFLASAGQQAMKAEEAAEQAIALDGSLGVGWLARGMSRIRKGDTENGVQDLETAAALEPNRSLPRSYLAKAYHQAGETDVAVKELGLGRELDSADPTPWLYLSLIRQEQNRINEAIRALDQSRDLNDNRRVYRSTHLLDQDRAVRGANLAGIFHDAGLEAVSVREATRAVNADYSNASAHLQLANSFNSLRDPRQINLRYETSWFSEFLMANLLSPVGAGRLSQAVSLNEYSRLFERDGLGLATGTEYFSNGDFSVNASQFGQWGRVEYALDVNQRWENGQRANHDLDQLTVSPKIKFQLTPHDTVYLQAIYYDFEAGDLNPYYDPNSARRSLRVQEEQEPIALAGWHHQWQPGVHTLGLVSRLHSRQRVTDPSQPVFLLARDPAGRVALVPKPGLPIATLDYESELEALSGEILQIWRKDRHTWVGGVRAQAGEFEARSRLGASSPVRLGNEAATTPFAFGSAADQQRLDEDFDRVSAYLYDYWQMVPSLKVSAGVSYDHLQFPRNYRVPPLTGGTDTEEQWSPKVGLTWTPVKGTAFRGAYTRSMGGVSLDQSVRLEPTQIAGFNQGFRGLIPESVAGSLAGARFETAGLAWDQQWGRDTFLTVSGEWLRSDAQRTVGSRDGFSVPPPNFTASPGTGQRLDYRERQLNAVVNRLVGRHVALGLGYGWQESGLRSDFVEIPVSVSQGAKSNQTADLHQIMGQIQWFHDSGWFARGAGYWTAQSNRGYSPDIPGDDFWQFDAWLGYRFWRRRVEARVGLINITDQDYRLNPLNLHRQPRRERTLTVSLRTFF